MTISSIRQLLTEKYTKTTQFILTLMYTVGLIGLQVPVLKPIFQELSAFNLWVSAGLLLIFHQDFRKNFIILGIICYLVGYWIEVVGVHTGIIFGVYQYGTGLGTKLFKVPLVIGTNWFILVYCSGIFWEKIREHFKFSWHPIVQGILIGTLMTSLDYLIEPVAIALDFWQWDNNIIPIRNYIAWWIISSILGYYFSTSQFLKHNPLAILLLVLQCLFFAGHTILFMLNN
ncbi:carotenoid biosynthesis protein [Flectobacillus longus]|uniref:carotenoid biosynthesis protein n=1 Tax=Flectobacillus longus TaxID=2984207 RepID=UPI0024B7CD66|nr:carotenoid biosynthesis protein [Flectobacillus longus]MDI9881276.1 carotenoid biosynthesis protein [Flectobacillus longus]